MFFSRAKLLNLLPPASGSDFVEIIRFLSTKKGARPISGWAPFLFCNYENDLEFDTYS